MSSSSSNNNNNNVVKLFSRIEELELADASASNSVVWKNKKRSGDPGDSSSWQKSKAAKSQLRLHHKLMELRILLQRYMSQVSQQQLHNSDKEILQVTEQIRNTLLLARRTMLNNHQQETTPIDASEAELVLVSDYEKAREEQWKPVLNQHQRALRIRSGAASSSSKQAGSSQQFRVMDPTFWDHIENVIAQEQLFPTAISIEDPSRQQKDGNGMIYMDGKLYSHMLQDFIASSSTSDDASTSTGTTTLKAMQLTMQKQLRNKKKVDRKASKGRKIRYKVHDKMTHYTFPVFRPTPAISEQDWFPSLFK